MGNVLGTFRGLRGLLSDHIKDFRRCGLKRNGAFTPSENEGASNPVKPKVQHDQTQSKWIIPNQIKAKGALYDDCLDNKRDLG